MPIVNTLSGEAPAAALPLMPVCKTSLRAVDPDLERIFYHSPTAKIPFLVILVEPYPPTDPRAVDVTTDAYREALASLAGPVISVLDRLQTSEHLIGYKELGAQAFFSACGDLESVRALSTLAQVEFVAYDGIPCPDNGPE